MCGILALFLRSPRTEDSYPITQIIEAFRFLKNRGPDSGSLIVRDMDILGFRRLAIIETKVISFALLAFVSFGKEAL